MKATIQKKTLAIVVLLSLVFQVNIPAVYAELPSGGYRYDVGQGDIRIEKGADDTLKVTHGGETVDHIAKDTMLTLTGTSTGGAITITGGVTANITFDGLNIVGDKTVQIQKNSTVYLTLKGDNVLENNYNNNSRAGLGVGERRSEGQKVSI